MGFFSRFGRPDPQEAVAAAIYNSLVAQARDATFYRDYGVPDTVNGRFDLIVLHATFVVRRLRAGAEAGAATSQALFDYMFKDMDRSLREIGVGDMSVGKHIKKMAKAFYGRAGEYEAGLDGDDAVLGGALKANLLRQIEVGPDRVAGLCAYARAADAALQTTALEDLNRGEVRWPPVAAI